jgi:hypothetical protein
VCGERRKGAVETMMTRVVTSVRTHRKLLMLTFEVFWIAVFLLDRIGRGTTGGVPGFVYVNF